MSGMRDRLIHDYMGVNYAIVWDVVKNKIPELYARVSEILEKEWPIKIEGLVYYHLIITYKLEFTLFRSATGNSDINHNHR